MDLREMIKSLVRLLPREGHAIRRVYWQRVRARHLRAIEANQKASGWHLPHSETVLWISPERIRNHTNFRAGALPTEPRNAIFGREILPNSVIGGDWDIGGIEFSELAAFRAIKARIEYRVPWRETEYFQESMRDINSGRVLWGCRTAEELDTRFSYVDGLIESIRRHGIVPYNQLGELNDFNHLYPENIEVNIGRHGQLLFQNGRHRLAIAKVLGLSRVPVSVLVRHLEWQKLREHVLAPSQGENFPLNNGRLHQGIPHPDLADIPTDHACEDFLEVMRSRLVIQKGRILDMKCDLGYFCQAFEKDGFDCIGLEDSPNTAHAANQLRIGEGHGFSIYAGDILDPGIHRSILGKPVDVIIAINGIQPRFNLRKNHPGLRDLLQKLNPQQMFCVPPPIAKSAMEDAYANPGTKEFMHLIKTNTGLGKAELIYVAPDGRELFSLVK